MSKLQGMTTLYIITELRNRLTAETYAEFKVDFDKLSYEIEVEAKEIINKGENV